MNHPEITLALLAIGAFIEGGAAIVCGKHGRSFVWFLGGLLAALAAGVK